VSGNGEFVSAYVERYRDMFPVRLVTIAGISVAAWLLIAPAWGLHFAIVQFGLYAIYVRVVEDARRRAAEPKTLGRLGRWTEILSLLLASHVAAYVAAAWLTRPDLWGPCLLLLIGNLMVGALQVHVTKLGFAAAVTPPSITLVGLTLRQAPHDTGLLWCVLLFIGGVLGACWRQHVTDRQAVSLLVERTVAADRLREALEAAEAERARSDQANRAKSKFLAMISHEVRTPLNVVLGLAEVLHRQTAPGPSQTLVTEIREAGGMLLRLLNAVLDLSKIESGHVTAQRAPVDVRALVEAIGRVWRLRVQEAGLALALEFEGEADQFVVQADGPKIEQTLINLISNALKLTPSGLLKIRALSLDDPAGRRLRFEVHDEGPGVAPEDRKRIFEPFEQLAAGRAAGGAGLGLAICQANLASMDGAIGVEGRAGPGSIFWFEVPAALAQRQALPASAAAPEAIVRPLSVLVVEDHPANRKLLLLLLEQLGATPAVAGNGQEALDACAARDFELVLMDVMMPVMDGLEALERLRAVEVKAGRRTPVYMLTANVFEDDVARYMRAGADGVLGKPIEVAELHALLQAAAAR
jgi:signal transduction histidine kinase/ActR/RegA family two-component response regulator